MHDEVGSSVENEEKGKSKVENETRTDETHEVRRESRQRLKTAWVEECVDCL